MGTGIRSGFKRMKPMLTEGPCLAHCAKEKDNMVTTDASKTGLGITLWQRQDDGNCKTNSLRKEIIE